MSLLSSAFNAEGKCYFCSKSEAGHKGNYITPRLICFYVNDEKDRQLLLNYLDFEFICRDCEQHIFKPDNLKSLLFKLEMGLM
jgi:hypothetical protein